MAGCGSDSEPATPAACLDGPDAFVKALEAAPGEVTLDGTPISECLTEGQDSGALAEVGGAMIDAARTLNEEARKQPLGDAPVQLGYLVGAVDARAEETGGIHQDLALNLEAEATFIPGDEVLAGRLPAALRGGPRRRPRGRSKRVAFSPRLRRKDPMSAEAAS